MRRVRAFIAGVMLAAVMCGCASTWQGLQEMMASPADTYRTKARDLEAQGELQQALLAWRIAARLEKDDAQTAKTVRNLESKIAKTARKHYLQGLKDYQSGDYRSALRNFLITLRIQPHHRKARYYLKIRLQNREQATYRVQSGDSFSRIASKIYNDPSKAYMIAYFNDLNPQKPLQIGTTLLLPALDTNYLQPRSNIKALLDQSQAAYEKKRYEEVFSLTRKIQNEIPKHPKARRLADAAHFEEGKRLLSQKRYLAAVEQFKQISPGYKGRDQAIANARTQIKQLAVDEKLKEAQQHLRANAWESAINVAEEILAHDPDNSQAKILFSNAGYNLGKRMLDRGKTVQAVDLLGRIDPSYEDTRELISLARARMRARAETHYRDGVKHFINEDLQLAIGEWKKALALNPAHPKARQDIDNAKRLLDKLRALETQSPGTP